MARKREEINQICGKNLKCLLSSNKMTQKQLAKELNYTEQHLSLIIKGKRRLTTEAARKIAEMFPGTRYEWLMGYDDYRTVAEKGIHDLEMVKTITEIQAYTISELASMSGYIVEFPGLGDKFIRVPLLPSGNDPWCRIWKDHELLAVCTQEQFNLLALDCQELIEQRIKSYIRGAFERAQTEQRIQSLIDSF